jgi:hypothetical protein
MFAPGAAENSLDDLRGAGYGPPVARGRISAIALAWLATLAPAASADTVGVPISVPGTGVLNGVACPTATTCEAVGDSGSGEVLVLISNGIPGHPISIPGTYELRGIACESATTCIAVGDNAANVGVVVPIVDATPGVPITVPGTSYIESIACQSQTSCTAVGGPIVPITGTTPGTPVTAGNASLAAIACQTATNCTAIGLDRTSYASVVVPISGGTPGPAVTVPGQPFADASSSAIACPSPLACTATGINDQNFGTVVAIQNGIPASPITRRIQFVGVACESATSCEGVGPSGVSHKLFVVPITGGAASRSVPAPGSFPHGSLNAAACVSATNCEVVGTTGYSGLAVATCIQATGQGCAELTGPVSTRHATVTDQALYCAGTSGQRCLVRNQLRTTQQRLVATKTITIRPGHVDQLTFTLTSAGKRLLKRLGKLHVTLTISQALSDGRFVILRRRLTLRR